MKILHAKYVSSAQPSDDPYWSCLISDDSIRFFSDILTCSLRVLWTQLTADAKLPRRGNLCLEPEQVDGGPQCAQVYFCQTMLIPGKQGSMSPRTEREVWSVCPVPPRINLTYTPLGHPTIPSTRSSWKKTLDCTSLEDTIDIDIPPMDSFQCSIGIVR
jgi:hypothetical protein